MINRAEKASGMDTFFSSLQPKNNIQKIIDNYAIRPMTTIIESFYS
jgi:hypothetical protein